MTFVGFLVSKLGIGMDPAKVAAILDWPTVTSLRVEDAAMECVDRIV